MAVDTFSEKCLIGITKSGGPEFQFAPITVYDSIDIDEGDKDMTYTATASGGRLSAQVPQTETTITMDMKPVGTSALANYEGLEEWFTGYAATLSKVKSSTNRYSFRVIITWTTDPNAATASGTLAASYDHWRYIAVNADLVSCKKNNTGDGSLSMTVKFKVAPFGKTGASAIGIQSTYGTLLDLGITWTDTYLGTSF